MMWQKHTFFPKVYDEFSPNILGFLLILPVCSIYYIDMFDFFKVTQDLIALHHVRDRLVYTAPTPACVRIMQRVTT